MAQSTAVLLEDDQDGTTGIAGKTNITTVEFTVDGVTYQTELTAANRALLTF
jgi:hypothetical protein